MAETLPYSGGGDKGAGSEEAATLHKGSALWEAETTLDMTCLRK